MEDLSLVFPAKHIVVRQVTGLVLDALRHLDLSVDEGGTAELLLAEVLNNIVDHAYRKGEGGRVSLRMRPAGSSVLFEVRDGGASMPGGELPFGKAPELSEDIHTLPESGFGWFLLRALARDIRYVRTENENQLYFTLCLDHVTL